MQVTQRLGRRMRERVASTGTSPKSIRRFDLKIWDHEIAGPNEARVLVGFSMDLGVPTRIDVEELVVKASGGQMRLIPESVRLHSEENLILASVIKIPKRVPAEYMSRMAAVGGDSYMDEKEDIWQMQDNGEGAKFLARIEREDIDAILTQYEKDTKTAAVHHRPQIANLRTAGVLDVSAGDHVSFMQDGKVFHGKVASINGDRIKIALSDKEVEVMTPDILDVKQSTEEFKGERREELINIYTQMYGSREFATTLVDL